MHLNEEGTELNNTTARVYRLLRKKILEGGYQKDQRLHQNELADMLNVSRTPVVKALHMLETDGLIDNIPQRGFYIHQVTLSEMIDLFMLRQSLEMIAAYTAAENATIEDLNFLEDLFTPFCQGEKPINHQAYCEADWKFHDYLFSLCGNRLVMRIDESMQIMHKTYMGGLLRQPEETLEEHRQIIAALKRRDPQTAQMLMMQHLEVTRKQMQSTSQRLSNMGIEASKLPIREFAVHNKKK